jgi:LysR family transcriptional activator of nhaA
MDWLNYHHLFYFWTVCKEGGFSKASTKLRIAQSAISMQITKLEEHLGEKLMERGPRGFTLTEAGQVALAQAEEIFRHGNDLLQYFKSGKMKSSFRVGALAGLSKNLQFKILSPVISNPTIELSLEVGDALVLVDRLINYKLDALLSDVPIPLSVSEPLVQTEIARETVCLVSRKKPKNNRNLNVSEWISGGLYLPAQSSPITSAIRELISRSTENYQIRGYIDDIALLRILALETDSIVAIPKIGVWREIVAKELFLIHEFKKVTQSYYLVYRQKGKRHPMLNILLK